MSDNESYNSQSGDDSSEDEELRGKKNDFGVSKGKKPILPKIPGRKPGSDEEEEEEEEDEEEEEEEEDDDDDDEYNDETVAEEVFGEPAVLAKGKKAKGVGTTPLGLSSTSSAFDLDNYDAGTEDDDDDDDSEEEEDGKSYLQKFDEFTKHNIIGDYHPELQQHNHDEIESLSVVARNAEGIIVDPFHRTLPFLTKYERARILGERARQLEAGAKPFLPVESGVIDSYLIAVAELNQKKIPFIVKRPLLNGGCEYWRLKDLEFL